MKNSIQIIALLFCFLVFAQKEVVALPVEAEEHTENIQDNVQLERIVSFNTDILIAENADVTVTENIKVYATGNEIKRGIFRALPTIRNINGRKEKVVYKIVSIEKDGVAESYHKETKNGIFTIYMGDEDSYLQSGYYTYKIVYKTQDQIGKFKGYDEYYWNVNGTDWSFPVENIQAKVHLPNGADILQNSCYTGVQGSTERNCTAQNLSATEIVFNAKNLQEHENLTVAVGFKANVLKEPSGFSKWISRNWPSLALVFVSLYLLFYYYTNWKKYGKDPEKPVLIPQFNAPGNLSPASLGYIDKGSFETSLVTANLVDLSIKGFVDIDEIKGTKESYVTKIFNIKKLKSHDSSLQNDQKQLIQKLFGNNNQISVNGSFNSTIKNAIEDFEKSVTKLTKKYFEKISNKKIVTNALKIILATFFVALLINSLITWDFKILLMGSIMLIFASLFVALLIIVWEDGKKLIFAVIFFFSMALFAPLLVMAFVENDDVSSFESNCFKFLIFGGISLLIFRYLIKKPTEEKVKMETEIEGFKMYLSVAEENQLKFHNPPEMTTDVYEKFLPYAIVFGVEGIWGKRFRDKLQETVDAGEESFANVQNHFGYGFANSFTNSLKETSVMPVSSFSSSSSSSSGSSSSSSYSGGSSSSGSSGGGSSGGGGGGGGGGGW
ncbi:Uncharacterized membrane protein [Chryseobacterium formosense]|uniref:DUF2207 domain-containing protein n=1 Tax=Chryseobacterium formosense TaxID=236814 RepID=UPI00068B6495|nr:DUF2207 domain-containing protein [Chryseobacterium formosense]SFT80959.1 Uncharacterized membrane protein [Chryseobacterium formosense]